ncbi:MAG: dTMP kinase [Propionibacteriaceae bacterium]|nr:dTMP kinase [Propionibacteriaceae bacterium]
MTGVFIVFEGGDGVGKSTQSQLLTSWLQEEGYTVVQTFEPGDSAVGSKIREILLSPETGELAPRAEALLYAADKAAHCSQVVLPALEQGKVVVCDRYIDSMIAYQGAGRVLDTAEVEQLARWASADLVPDLTIVLDLDADIAISGLSELDRIESAGSAFHARVRQHFLRLAQRDPQRYLVIPARLPIAENAARIQARVAALLAECLTLAD